MNNMFKNKSILVTGGAGTIGSEIIRQVLEQGPRIVRVFDNDENGMFNFEQNLLEHKNFSNLRFLLGDVRDEKRLHRAMEGIEIVFHAAALKHVPLCEYNPIEAIKTNVDGTQNIINAALDKEVSKVITISTDKAVNPASTMGATKLLMERLTIDANNYRGNKNTLFSCVRFGNVFGSRGSVIPLFYDQIKKGGPLKVTDPDMTRFIMSISEAVKLVLKAAEITGGGEIFILKMPTIRLGDLAEVMVQELSLKHGFDPKKIKIEKIGVRNGEKMYEELMTEDEALKTIEIDGLYVLRPQKIQKSDSKCKLEKVHYNSNESEKLSRDAIIEIIQQHYC